jgi:V/A-type H+-transporting ATPase subunit A
MFLLNGEIYGTGAGRCFRRRKKIVGVEGLQDPDRLLMHVAELIRMEFLSQNAYSDDAFSPPVKTLSLMKQLLDFYEGSAGKLEQGIALEDIIAREKK